MLRYLQAPQQAKVYPSIDDIQRKQQMAELLLQKSLQGGPVQSWTQGAARLAGAYLGKKRREKASQMKEDYNQRLSELLLGKDGDATVTPERIAMVMKLNPELGQQMLAEQQKMQYSAKMAEQQRRNALEDFRAKEDYKREHRQPTVQEFFDPQTGQPYKAQYDPQSGQWSRIGGVKAPSVGTSLTVNTGSSGPQVGSIPQGFALTKDDDGRYYMEAIRGGPQDPSKREDAAKIQGSLVSQEIRNAIDAIEANPVATTGALSYTSKIPNTPAKAVANRLKTITANIGFDKLQEMRNNSPTGGALGQVSDFENRQLQAVKGSLDQSQSADDLLYNLERLDRLYNAVVNGVPNGMGGYEPLSPQNADKVYGQSFGEWKAQRKGGAQEQAPQGPPPQGVDPEVWKYMTPEERALWAN